MMVRDLEHQLGYPVLWSHRMRTWDGNTVKHCSTEMTVRAFKIQPEAGMWGLSHLVWPDGCSTQWCCLWHLSDTKHLVCLLIQLLLLPLGRKFTSLVSPRQVAWKTAKNYQCFSKPMFFRVKKDIQENLRYFQGKLKALLGSTFFTWAWRGLGTDSRHGLTILTPQGLKSHYPERRREGTVCSTKFWLFTGCSLVFHVVVQTAVPPFPWGWRRRFLKRDTSFVASLVPC